MTLRCKQFSDLFIQNVNTSVIVYLLSWVMCVWNWHQKSISKHYSTSDIIYICMVIIATFFLHSYPFTAYYVPYSCQCQYFLKCNITTFVIFGQIGTGSMDLFFSHIFIFNMYWVLKDCQPDRPASKYFPASWEGWTSSVPASGCGRKG